MDDAPSSPPAPARTQRNAKGLIAVVLLLLGLWVGHGLLPALIWAGIIAIAIDPLYTRAQARWPRHRGILLPTIATLLVAILVLAPLAIGIVQAAREAEMVAGWIADVRDNGLPAPALLQKLPYAADITAWWQANLGTPDATAHQLHRVHSELIERYQSLGRDILHRSIIFAFTLLALFFVLRDREAIIRQLHRAGDRLLGPAGERMGVQAVRSVRGTIDGLVLVGIGEGAAMAVAYVVAGVPHPLLLGSLTAVAAMIPFGAVVLFAIASAMLAAQGAVGWAVGVFAIGMVVLFVADHFVRPFLIGGATRLPFLFVLIGILGGVETLGLLGLFVGPATMAVLMLLWREYVAAPVDHAAAVERG